MKAEAEVAVAASMAANQRFGYGRTNVARAVQMVLANQIPPIVDFVRVPDGSPLVTYLGYARKV